MRRLASDGTWVAGGQVASALGSLLGIRLLTEIMSPEVFGNVSLLLGIAALAMGFATAPLMHAILRFYPASEDAGHLPQLRRIALRTLVFSCLATGLLLVGGWAIWQASFGGWFWMGILLVAILFVDSFRSLGITFLSAARRQQSMSFWTALESWLRPGFAAILILYFGESAPAVLVGYLTASSLLLFNYRGIFTTHREQQQEVSATFPRHSTLAVEMLRYALPLIPLAIVGWISGQADRYILGGILDLWAVGIYTAIYGLVSRPFLLAGATVELTIRPLYYRAVMGGDRQQAADMERRWLQALIVICTLGVLTLIMWHAELATVFLAKDYRGYSFIMPLVALGYSFLVVAQFYERICYAHDRTSAGLIIQVIGAVASIGITVPLVWKFGLVGAAAAVPGYFGLQMLVARYLAGTARIQFVPIKSVTKIRHETN